MATEFIIGQPYFFLRFAGSGVKVPVIDSFVYIGQDLEAGEPSESRWFFQDPDSYFREGPYQPSSEGEEITAEDAAELEDSGHSRMEVHSYSADAALALVTLEELTRRLLALQRA